MSEAIWYYAVGSDRKGPVPVETLRALVEAGAIQPDTRIWSAGLVEWEPAWRHVPGVVPPAPQAQAAWRAPDGPPDDSYGRGVGFGEAFRLFWSNYGNFTGRSPRSAFWWWVLWALVIGAGAAMLDYLFIDMTLQVTPFNWLWNLVTVVPSLALGARRLHDTGRSGWWQLVALTGVGIILLIVWWCQPSDPGPNRYA